MARAGHFAFLMVAVACLAPVKALAQGETTSAIVGQVGTQPTLSWHWSPVRVKSSPHTSEQWRSFTPTASATSC